MKSSWHFIVHGFATLKNLELEEAHLRTKAAQVRRKKRLLAKEIWKHIDKLAPKELERCDDTK